MRSKPRGGGGRHDRPRRPRPPSFKGALDSEGGSRLLTWTFSVHVAFRQELVLHAVWTFRAWSQATDARKTTPGDFEAMSCTSCAKEGEEPGRGGSRSPKNPRSMRTASLRPTKTGAVRSAAAKRGIFHRTFTGRCGACRTLRKFAQISCRYDPRYSIHKHPFTVRGEPLARATALGQIFFAPLAGERFKRASFFVNF